MNHFRANTVGSAFTQKGDKRCDRLVPMLRGCDSLRKTDSLAIVYDCNPLEIKDLFSSNVVHKFNPT